MEETPLAALPGANLLKRLPNGFFERERDGKRRGSSVGDGAPALSSGIKANVTDHPCYVSTLIYLSNFLKVRLPAGELLNIE
jgi:hypothetical protein